MIAVNTRLRKLDRFPFFLAHLVFFIVCLSLANLALDAVFGGTLDSGTGPGGKIIGPSIFLTALVTSQEMRRRRKDRDKRDGK